VTSREVPPFFWPPSLTKGAWPASTPYFCPIPCNKILSRCDLNYPLPHLIRLRPYELSLLLHTQKECLFQPDRGVIEENKVHPGKSESVGRAGRQGRAKLSSMRVTHLYTLRHLYQRGRWFLSLLSWDLFHFLKFNFFPRVVKKKGKMNMQSKLLFPNRKNFTYLFKKTNLWHYPLGHLRAIFHI